MALLHLALGAVAAWAYGSAALAQPPAPAHRQVEIRFVPASGNGTVSLGIYDAEGRLVRVLCDEWTFNRFRVGLNGLATVWDGRDDRSQPVPPGRYTARGFIVGDLGISGEAIHFNDWIEGLDSPRIVAVKAQQLLADGDVLLAARLAGNKGALVRYSPESEARWRTVVSGSSNRPEATVVQMAVSDALAFVLIDGKLAAVDLADGAERTLPASVAVEGIQSLAARGDRMALLVGNKVRFFRGTEFASQGEAKDAPAELVSIALLEEGAVAAAADGSVWRWQAGWSRLDLPDGVKVRGLSGGRADTFWTIEERGEGVSSAAQYSAEEGLLAEWVPAPQDGTLTAVSGAVDRDYFAATLTSAEVQRSVAIRRKADTSGWEFVYDKRITSSDDFGWVDGRLSANGRERPAELTVTLAENPLDPAASRKLLLRAVSDGTGTGLATADGLPLLRVTEAPGDERVMIVAGHQPDTARFFQGDGACVEEYQLTKLDDIFSFSAGEVVLTGTGEAVPPPAEDPGD